MLWLNSNYLAGTIPAWISEMSALEELYLDHNRCGGRWSLTAGRAADASARPHSREDMIKLLSSPQAHWDAHGCDRGAVEPQSPLPGERVGDTARTHSALPLSRRRRPHAGQQSALWNHPSGFERVGQLGADMGIKQRIPGERASQRRPLTPTCACGTAPKRC